MPVLIKTFNSLYKFIYRMVILSINEAIIHYKHGHKVLPNW